MTTVAFQGQGRDPLPSSNDGPAKRAIVAFVAKVTKPGSPDFVPEPDRIATFDKDGTLWAGQPMYFQLIFVLDRIKAMAPQHPEWKSKEPFAPLLKGDVAKALAGGGIEFMRPWTERAYGIPPEQVVGSSIKTKYQVRDGKPVLVRLPEIDFVDDKAGRPVGINSQIGRRPLAAFGNSAGDAQMLEYTKAGDGARLALILLHDGAQRECAYGAAQGLPPSSMGTLPQSPCDQAVKRGWIVISTKNDWTQVFAFGQQGTGSRQGALARETPRKSCQRRRPKRRRRARAAPSPAGRRPVILDARPGPSVP